jgi:hypothetical protein
MPFDIETRQTVDAYARQDLNGDLHDHIEFFSFLKGDPELMKRVGEEYYSARYLYKLWEGLRIEDEWARRAQIQLQVQQYASIYEACLHHLLFACCKDLAEVRALLNLSTLKPWSVSQDIQQRLNAINSPEGRHVVAAIESTIRLSDTKVRFDSKARAAASIGIIDTVLMQELVEFYTARNMIHIHAELKQGADWTWEIEFARQAYWRLAKFRDQVIIWQESYKQPNPDG